MERAGTGIERIKNFCKNSGNKVKFDFDDFWFFTIIGKKDKIETTRKILDIIKENSYITRKELSDRLEDITEDGIKYHLKQLKQKGALKRIDPDKGVRWERVNDINLSCNI